jgi:hypothetical protein
MNDDFYKNRDLSWMIRDYESEKIKKPRKNSKKSTKRNKFAKKIK